MRSPNMGFTEPAIEEKRNAANSWFKGQHGNIKRLNDPAVYAILGVELHAFGHGVDTPTKF